MTQPLDKNNQLIPSPDLFKMKTKSLSEISDQLNLPKNSNFPSVNPEDDSFKKVYKSIIDMNRNYLTEKVTVSQIKKPGKYELKLPSNTGTTEYSRKYSSGKRSYTLNGSIPNYDRKTSNISHPTTQVTGLQSSYRNDFSSRTVAVPRPTLSTLNKKNVSIAQQKLPSFNQTVYNRDYNTKSITTTEPIRHKESTSLGAKFNGQSTYQSNYKPKDNTKTLPPEPIIHKGHQIFVGINKKPHSNYQDNYLLKKIEAEPSCKPVQKRAPVTHHLNRRSEYKTCFSSMGIERQKKFECLNRQQLDRYMLDLKQ